MSTPPSPSDLPLFTGPVIVDTEPTQRRTPQARRLAGSIGDHPTDSTESVGEAEPAAPATSGGEDDDTEPAGGGLAPKMHTATANPRDVRLVRTTVSDALVGDQNGRQPTAEQDGPRARQLIHDEVLSLNQRRLQAGTPPLSPTEQRALEQSVFDALFGLGRLEELLTQPGLKSLEMRRSGRIHLIFGDGRIEEAAPLADTTEGLVEEISRLARTSGTERPFDRSHPNVDLRLPDGSRLNAQAWFSPYPMITIRKHGYVDIDMDGYVKLGSASPAIAAFLTAATKAHRTIVVAGVPGAGKTTLLRALLNVLPPQVPIGTIETEDELGLHTLEERHPRVWAGQELVGGGEVVDGRSAGSLSVGDMIPIVLRAGVQIIVVGEVRGHEIIAMLEAMTAGHTSMTTVHAKNGRDAVERLVTCATKYGEVNTTWAYRQIAQLVDIIVHVDLVDETPLGGRQHHYISEIVLPQQSGDAGYSVPAVFHRGPDGRAVPDPTMRSAVPWMDELRRHGFDPDWLEERNGGWDQPLDLKLPVRRTS